MDWFRLDAADFATDGADLGVAIFGSNGSFHTGLLYRDETNTGWFLHLAFHHDLVQDQPPTRAHWAASKLSTVDQQLIAEFCHLVWERHRQGGLPYGFDYADARFQESGEFVVGATSHGLTCATFVLAVVERAANIRLLDTATWVHRATDVQWQESILTNIEDHACELERRLESEAADLARKHATLLQGEVGCVRYRPSEVVAAFNLENPADFVAASVLGAAIEQELDSARDRARSPV